MTLAGRRRRGGDSGRSTETWGELWQGRRRRGVTLAGRRRRGVTLGGWETWGDSGRSDGDVG